MNADERLINTARELLAEGKAPLSEIKEMFYDKKAKQFSIKIPKEIVLAAKLNPKSKMKIVVNPDRREFEELKQSHFIIYGKEKEITT